ncbi:MAG: vWA domain-containing protein, partial [Thermomicrobiales bacterium]
MQQPRLRLDRLSPGARARLINAIERSQQALTRDRGRSQQVIDFSRLNATQFRRIVEDWPLYHQLAEEGTNRIPFFRDLMSDIYFALYLHRPNWRERDEMQADHRMNHDLLEQARRLPLWQQQRTRSVARENHSRIGLTILARAMLDAIEPDDTEQAETAREQQQQRQQTADDLAQALDDLQQMLGDGDPDGDPGKAAPTLPVGDGDTPDPANPDDDAANAAADALEAMAMDLENDPAESSADPDRARRAMRHGLQDAAQQLAHLDDVLARWGVEPGEFDAMPAVDAMDAFERLRELPNLRAFADELGRHREDMKLARRQVNSPEPEEMVDVAPGRTIGYLLPSEWLLMSDPEFETIFWIRYMQDALQTWQYAGRSRASRGPFVLLLDVSGSTEGPRQIWGKAFALATLEMARHDHRDVGIVFFDAVVRPEGVFSFPGGRATLNDKLRLAEYWTGGGTDFMQPLSVAIANIEAATGE